LKKEGWIDLMGRNIAKNRNRESGKGKESM
jgi:hypothetical protein